MSGHILPKKTYYSVFAALMVLLVVTIGVAFINLGGLNIAAALTIAVIKAVVIILYFMHVRYSSRLTWLIVGAGFFWLGILLVLAGSDYLTRQWLPQPSGWEDTVEGAVVPGTPAPQ
jgi:cytochrome c oxidase subunit 4